MVQSGRSHGNTDHVAPYGDMILSGVGYGFRLTLTNCISRNATARDEPQAYLRINSLRLPGSPLHYDTQGSLTLGLHTA